MGPRGSVLLGAFCLSISAILVKLAGVDAATTAFLRCALAVIFLLPLALLERRRRGPLSRAGIGWALVAGAALGLDYSAWTASIYHVGAGISTVLINVQVVVLPLLGLLVDRERLAPRFLVALPVMLLGISLVGGLWSGATPGSGAVLGTVLGVLAGCGYATYLFLTRRASRRDPGLMIQPLAWSTTAAACAAALVSPISGGLHLTGIAPGTWGLLVLLALVGQVLAWWLVNQGSVRLAPATTATLLLTQPVLALLLAALVLAEYPDRWQVVGTVLVLLAVAFANRILRLPQFSRAESRPRR